MSVMTSLLLELSRIDGVMIRRACALAKIPFFKSRGTAPDAKSVKKSLNNIPQQFSKAQEIGSRKRQWPFT
jgi:hypothetical protein